MQSGYKLWGVPFKAAERDMASIIYIFYVSKIYEFMDTFIMLLKGNVKQVRRRLPYSLSQDEPSRFRVDR